MFKNLFFVSFLFLIGFCTQAQENPTDPKAFAIGLDLKLGNGNLNTVQYKNLQGSVSGAELNFNYNFAQNTDSNLNWRVGLGIEVSNFRTNIFNGNSQAGLAMDYIRIPVKINPVIRLNPSETNFFHDVKFIAGIGGFLNYAYSYEINTLDDSLTLDDDTDVNFGYLFDLSFEYDVSDQFTIATGFVTTLMGEDNEKHKLNLNTNQFYMGARYRL